MKLQYQIMEHTKLVYNIILNIIVWSLVWFAIYCYHHKQDIFVAEMDTYLQTHEFVTK